jgi:hypothetical protein
MPKKGGPCGQPFHPATGHWESETRHWCGPCTRGMVLGLIETTAGRCLTTRLRNPDRTRSGEKLRTPFYIYACPPPPARCFEFRVYVPVPGSRCTFTPVIVRKPARSLQEALLLLDDTHPGHGISEHLRGLWQEISSGSDLGQHET